MLLTEIIPVVHMVNQNQVFTNVETCVSCGVKKIFLINHQVIPSFTRIDANISYSEKSYSIVLSVNNLTSSKYFTNGYMNIDDPNRQLFANPPINAFVTLKYFL